MNSIGNLLFHLSGSVKQWIVAGLGTVEAVRNRPAEFSQRSSFSKAEVLEQLACVVAEANSVLSQPSAVEMLAARRIQGY